MPNPYRYNFFASPPLHSFHILSSVKYPHPIPLFLSFPFPSFSSSLFNQSINQATDGQTNKRTNNLTAEYLRYDNIQFIISTSGTTYTHTQRKKNQEEKKKGKDRKTIIPRPMSNNKNKNTRTHLRARTSAQLSSTQLRKEKGDTIPSFLSFLPIYGQGELEQRPGRVGFCTMDGSMDE